MNGLLVVECNEEPKANTDPEIMGHRVELKLNMRIAIQYRYGILVFSFFSFELYFEAFIYLFFNQLRNIVLWLTYIF